MSATLCRNWEICIHYFGPEDNCCVSADRRQVRNVKRMFNLGRVGSEPHQNGPGCKSNRICLLSTLWQPCLWNATLKEEVTLCSYPERNSKMVAIDIHTSWRSTALRRTESVLVWSSEGGTACMFLLHTQDVISAFRESSKTSWHHTQVCVFTGIPKSSYSGTKVICLQ